MPAPAETFFIASFHKQGGRLVAGAPRPAVTAESAKARAKLLKSRRAGVIAVAMSVDPLTSELIDFRELARYGQAPTINV